MSENEKKRQQIPEHGASRRRGRTPYRHDWRKLVEEWERFRNRIWSVERPKIRDFCRNHGISERSFRHIRAMLTERRGRSES
jgi:hypothetical protein